MTDYDRQHHGIDEVIADDPLRESKTFLIVIDDNIDIGCPGQIAFRGDSVLLTKQTRTRENGVWLFIRSDEPMARAFGYAHTPPPAMLAEDMLPCHDHVSNLRDDGSWWTDFEHHPYCMDDCSYCGGAGACSMVGHACASSCSGCHAYRYLFLSRYRLTHEDSYPQAQSPYLAYSYVKGEGWAMRMTEPVR